jgi:putative ABC transport system permease protein
MEALLRDLQHSARSLFRKPGFVFVAALTLALGIGANTSVFTVINTVLFRPLPIPEENRLAVIQEFNIEKPDDGRGVSYPNFNDWRTNCTAFESMSIVGETIGTWQSSGEPVRVRGAVVSHEFFKTLGVNPQLGRAFEPNEESFNHGFEVKENANQPEIIIPVMFTDSGWRRLYGGDPTVVGKTSVFDGSKILIIGVTPANLFPVRDEPIDFWTTVAVNGSPAIQGSANGSRGYRAYKGVIGRLKPGVSIEQGLADVQRVQAGLREQFPKHNARMDVMAQPLRKLIVGDAAKMLWLTFGVVAAVLLIACVNVANLLLARTASKRREIAVRSALGASRLQIIRQLLSEGLILAALGGLAGFGLSHFLIQAIVTLLPADIPRPSDLNPDWRVMTFTFVAVTLAGLVSGLFPALSLRKGNLADGIKEDSRTSAGGPAGNRLRSALVVSQIAIALMPLAGAGLLVNSLIRLRQVNPGFATDRILTVQMALSGSQYYEDGMGPRRIAGFLDLLTERLRTLPGVTSVSYAQCVPLTNQDNNTQFDIVERPIEKENKPTAGLRFIGVGYFSTLSIPIQAGRDFNERDDAAAPRVALVNEAFARLHFKGENPVGKKLKMGWGGEEPKEIVGVVGNVRHRSLSDEVRPEMYVPQAQFGNAGVTLLLRSTVDPESLVKEVKREVRAIDPNLPLTDIKSLAEYREAALALPRFVTFVLTGFSLLALILTTIGLYGVVSYGVAQRTREIGIRMALGATAGDILNRFLGQGLKLAAVGVGAGVIGAICLTRLLASLLYDVTPTDPATLFLVALSLLATSAAACWIPARRAAKAEPMHALRHES